MTINKTTVLCGSILVAAAMTFATAASAQATRTWVSGVGDDVNPCSRTAPCKTFAGAISKTAAGGEINCLDPGGFGAVTITKSLTISCPYTEGGALAGGNGITVNAQATDVVYIRGLDIFGVNPPTHGIRFIAGGALVVEDTTIRRFNSTNSFGISFQPSGTSRLFLNNVTIADNGNGATGGGINIQPTGAAGNGRVIIQNSRFVGNANNGIRIDTNGNTGPGTIVLIDDTTVTASTNGISVNSPSSSVAVAVMNSNISNNSGIGITANGGTAQMQVGNSTISGNSTGVQQGGGAVINTFGNNRVVSNAAPGAFTLPALQGQ